LKTDIVLVRFALCFRKSKMIELSPFTIHHSPFTIHPSPFTIHHSPFTLHHSPLAIDQIVHQTTAYAAIILSG
jgi:hypothetical protein